jgi:hypothetical protein
VSESPSGGRQIGYCIDEYEVGEVIILVGPPPRWLVGDLLGALPVASTVAGAPSDQKTGGLDALACPAEAHSVQNELGDAVADEHDGQGGQYDHDVPSRSGSLTLSSYQYFYLIEIIYHF